MTPGIRQFCVSALTASLSLAVFAGWAGEIKGVGVSTGATGTRAEIQLAGSGGFKTLSLANPNRLVVDFPDSSGVRGLKLPTAAGLVTSVRTGQPVPGTFRVVFELATPVTPLKPQMQTIGSGSTLVIEWPGDPPPAATSAVATAATPASAPTPRPLNAQTEAARATAALAASAQQRASSVPPPQPQTPSPAPYVPASAMPTITQAPVPTTVATGIPTPRPTTDNAAPTGVAGSVPNLATAPTGNALAGAVAAGSSAAAAAILNGDSAPMGVATSGSSAAGTSNGGSSAVAAANDDDDDDLPPRPVLPNEASRIKMAPGMRVLIVAIDPAMAARIRAPSAPPASARRTLPWRWAVNWRARSMPRPA